MKNFILLCFLVLSSCSKECPKHSWLAYDYSFMEFDCTFECKRLDGKEENKIGIIRNTSPFLHVGSSYEYICSKKKNGGTKNE